MILGYLSNAFFLKDNLPQLRLVQMDSGKRLPVWLKSARDKSGHLLARGRSRREVHLSGTVDDEGIDGAAAVVASTALVPLPNFSTQALAPSDCGGEFAERS